MSEVKKKTIADTYVFNLLNIKSAFPAISDINNNLKTKQLDPQYVNQILHEIKYKITFPSKMNIVSDIENNSIVFVNDPKSSMLPTWALKVKNSPKLVDTAVVNLFGKVNINDEAKTISFNVREVFALAQIGYVIREFYNNENKIRFNYPLLTLSMKIYTRLFVKILDILFSIDTLPQYSNQVRFLVAKFFLIYVAGKTNSQETDDIAYSFVKNAIGYDVLKSSLVNTPSDIFDSLPKFIEGLASIIPFLKKLEISAFLRKMIIAYGEKSLLMLENYNYFIAIVISNTITGNYVKDYAFDPSVGKDGIALYNKYMELTRT